MSEGKSTVALGLLILLALIWGSSFILIKKGLVALTPEEVGSLRIVAASIVLLPFAVGQFRKIASNHWKYLISVGLAGSLIPSFLFAIAQTQLDSAVVGILNALTPLFTILIASLLYGHRHRKRVYIGVFIGFFGSVFLITAGNGGGISGINPYALLIVMATIFYATNLNLIKEHLQGLNALTITSISLTIVGPAAAIYLLGFTDFLDKMDAGVAFWWSAGYIVLLGVLGTSIALIIFNHIVRLTNPLFTSSVTYVIPIIAVGWGLSDGETLTMLHYLGMLLIISGVYVANRPVRRE